MVSIQKNLCIHNGHEVIVLDKRETPPKMLSMHFLESDEKHILSASFQMLEIINSNLIAGH
jgi:hypothetical protein